MKRSFAIVVGLIILFIGGVVFVHREKPLATPSVPQGVQTVEGTVQSIAASAGILTITTADQQTLTLALNETTQLFDVGSSASATLAVFRVGFSVRAVGEFSRADTLIASSVRITNAPQVFLTSPIEGDEVGLPVVVRGEARVFENVVNARVRDADGTVLGEVFGMANAPDIGLYGPFELPISYRTPKSATGTVEAFSISAKDGEEINKVIVPIRFKQVASREVKIFFSSSNDNGVNCEATYATVRRVAATSAIARAALEELLSGPTTDEARNGFLTSIPSGVKIQKLTIENGVAKVDFSAALEGYGGGSCRVTAIHSQIKNTLMQFPTIHDVVVSIDGRTEDILQP